jgi:hypothetical protein
MHTLEWFRKIVNLQSYVFETILAIELIKWNTITTFKNIQFQIYFKISSIKINKLCNTCNLRNYTVNYKIITSTLVNWDFLNILYSSFFCYNSLLFRRRKKVLVIWSSTYIYVKFDHWLSESKFEFDTSNKIDFNWNSLINWVELIHLMAITWMDALIERKKR